jgi:F0F1-type ATP synthase delta subunit
VNSKNSSPRNGLKSLKRSFNKTLFALSPQSSEISMEKFSGPLSRRYGTALFESLKDALGTNRAEFETISNTIRHISKEIDKKTINIFKNQSLPLKAKQDLLEEFLKITIGKDWIPQSSRGMTEDSMYKLLFNFMLTVIKNKRFGLIHHIFDFYSKQSDAYLDIVRASIVSARPMSKDTAHQFESSISQHLKKKVVFSNFIDESLQCGFLLQIGSMNIDASLKSVFAKLKMSLQ